MTRTDVEELTKRIPVEDPRVKVIRVEGDDPDSPESSSIKLQRRHAGCYWLSCQDASGEVFSVRSVADWEDHIRAVRDYDEWYERAASED